MHTILMANYEGIVLDAMLNMFITKDYEIFMTWL